MKERIKAWNSDDLSKLPIFEPGLKDIIKKCRGKNLFFQQILKKILQMQILFLFQLIHLLKPRELELVCASDLKWIESSARQIAKFAKNHTVVVEKSTLPVKTAETIKNILNSSDENNLNMLKKFFNSYQILNFCRRNSNK